MKAATQKAMSVILSVFILIIGALPVQAATPRFKVISMVGIGIIDEGSKVTAFLNIELRDADALATGTLHIMETEQGGDNWKSVHSISFEKESGDFVYEISHLMERGKDYKAYVFGKAYGSGGTDWISYYSSETVSY